MDLPIPAAVTVARPTRQSAPLVFASAHSGRDYPDAFVAAARLDPIRLRRSEDGFVDELFAAAPDHGAPLLAARFPRAFCDANREAWELDPAMFEETLPDWVNTGSPRVGAGLGTIARIVASGETIYREKLRFAEAEARVRAFWEPFHDTLQALLAETRESFGACLLIDCHSMPGNCAAPRACPDFVLGDAHGTACAASAVQHVETVLRELGFSVRRNDPYAGGYITRHYGRPREGIHAVQVEINRALYMDEALVMRLPGFGDVQARMTRFVATLAGDWPRLGLI